MSATLCWLALLATCVLAQEQKVLTIGLLAPLNRDGEQIQIGVEIAQTLIAAGSRGGLPELAALASEYDYRIALEVRSTEDAEKVTLENSLELVNDVGVSAIVGPQSSANAEIVSLVASLSEVPAISYAATAASLSDKTQNDYFYRTVPSDTAQGRAMVAFVRDLGYKKVFVLHTDDQYGFGLLASIRDAASATAPEDEDETDVLSSASGVNAVGVNFNDDEAIAAAVTALANELEADAELGVILLLAASAPEMVNVLREAVDQDLIGDSAEESYVWLLSNGGSDLTRESGEAIGDVQALRGLIATAPARARDTDLYEISLREAWDRLVESGRTVNRNGVQQPLPDLDNAAVAVAYAFDAVVAVARAALTVLEDGASDVTPQLLARALTEVNFEGATGIVTFDRNYDRPPLYDIINIGIDPSVPGLDLWNAVARFENGYERIPGTTIRFRGGETDVPVFETPPPTPPPELVPPPNTGLIVGMVVLAIAVCVALTVLGLFLFSKRRAAKAAERERLLNQPPETWTATEEREELEGRKALASGIVTAVPEETRADYKVTFGKNKEVPLFGTAKGERLPVMQTLLDEMKIYNHSASPLQYTIYIPSTDGEYELDARPGAGTVKAKTEKTVRLSFKMLQTMRLRRHMKLVLHDVGEMYIPLTFEGEVSLRIDPNELELQGKPIGDGAFGAVYRGKYRGTVIAAKVLQRQAEQDDQQVDRFMKEIELFEKLRNPYIVNFIGASHIPGKLCICTELLERGSVYDMLKTVRVPLPLKVKMLVDASKAISFLHENGVLYRDLKPDNLLVFSVSLSAVVNCKLVDFGTARTVQDPQARRAYTHGIGTPIYMAPELMEGAEYNAKVDVYSFGMVTWHLLAEKVPYENVQSVWDLPRIVIDGLRPSIDETWDERLREVIAECWLHNEARRPPMAAVTPILEEALEDIKVQHESAKKSKRAKLLGIDSDTSAEKQESSGDAGSGSAKNVKKKPKKKKKAGGVSFAE